MSKAQISKEKGNEAFKKGNYADAVGFYTAAILDDRGEPTYPLNRAAAYLKLGKYEDAERDCTTVLTLSPKNPKAFFRRGQARLALENLLGAEKDFNQASILEPTNQTVNDAVMDLDRNLAAKRDKAAASTASQKFVDPNPRRRRVPIKVINAATPEGVPPQGATLSASDPGLKEVSSRPLKPSEIPPPATSLNTTPPTPYVSHEKPSSFKEAKQARDNVRPSRVGGGIFRASGPTTVFPTRDTTPALATPPFPAQSPQKAPETLSDLIKAWGSLSTADERWNLLSTIPPQKFPSLCKTSLEPPFLSSIFDALYVVLLSADLTIQIAVRSFLDYLVLVPRFNTIFLFLSKGEKQIVRDVWKQLGVETPEGAWVSLLK